MTDYIDGRVARTWITGFDRRFRESQDYLTDLDRLAGDEYFGDNIASALDRTHAALPATGPHTGVFSPPPLPVSWRLWDELPAVRDVVPWDL